jgi:SNF2 family DNA or RNA helicase
MIYDSHCDGSLNISIYHGTGRDPDPSTLVDYDIVLSTYHTIAIEALDSTSPLKRIKWFRIVLDEGIVSENHQTHI